MDSYYTEYYVITDNSQAPAYLFHMVKNFRNYILIHCY